MEDTFSHIVGSIGRRSRRASICVPRSRSWLAKATLSPKPKLRWDEWVGDYC